MGDPVVTTGGPRGWMLGAVSAQRMDGVDCSVDAVIAETLWWWRGDVFANFALVLILQRAVAPSVNGWGGEIDAGIDATQVTRMLNRAVRHSHVRVELVEWCRLVGVCRGGRADRDPRLWLADIVEYLTESLDTPHTTYAKLDELREVITTVDAALAAARPLPEMRYPDTELLVLIDRYAFCPGSGSAVLMIFR
ncbi:hypothetical protein P3H15_16990 [Rhodococcus sp. T2V]|uniref:hypothetical protein n=1 Tax=Rhodococcus sp. T2V TaxID=3034164 RepID=UPI0023E1F3BA|nr:hypothetical protein [Rhodococcus sp. T2V]MDF3306723.1 hypothetical protein [Rhodococcus sp. T2V]